MIISISILYCYISCLYCIYEELPWLVISYHLKTIALHGANQVFLVLQIFKNVSFDVSLYFKLLTG